MGKENNIILACDVNDFETFKNLVNVLYPTIEIFKIGLESYLAFGDKAIEYVHKKGGKVFLDLKFHDIPNTVKKVALEAMKKGVFMFNIHALGGTAMMRETSQYLDAAAKKEGMEKPLLIAVTVLTSMGESDLNEMGIEKDPAEMVLHLAKKASESGLAGVVSSPKEVEIIKKACGDSFILVTPGIRPSWASTDDQKRITTPGEAFKKGADYIVVGRPITGADNPKEAAKKIKEEIKGAIS